MGSVPAATWYISYAGPAHGDTTMVHHCVSLAVSGSKAAIAANETSTDYKCIATLTAPAGADDTRAPVDVVAVIDRSGSMRGQKLELVKEALLFCQRQLLPGDRFSIISYDTNVRMDLPLTAMDTNGKAAANAAARKLTAGTQTNLSGGLLKGMSTLTSRTEDASKPGSVLLFTDGLANQGIRDADGITAAMQGAMAHSNCSFSVHTFGFGADHDASMLQGIASNADGMYYFVENTDAIPSSFADCLGGLVSVAAQNMQLRVRALNGAKIARTHGKSEVAEVTPQAEYVLQLGDLYCEEERDTLFSLQLPACSKEEATAVPYLDVSLEYFNVLDSGPETASATLAVSRPAQPSVAQIEEVNERLEEQFARLEVANAMAEANLRGTRGDYRGAQELPMGVQEQLSRRSQSEYLVDLQEDLAECGSGFKSRESYNEYGSKLACNLSLAHHKQRSYNPEKRAYKTKAKSAMIDEAKRMRTESAPHANSTQVPQLAPPATEPGTRPSGSWFGS